MSENDERQEFSRRGFLFRAGAPALAAAAAGAIAAPATAAPATPAAAGSRTMGPGEVPIALDVNGEVLHLTVEPRVTLLDALRERLHLTGTKKGCGQGTCGACTVLVNGRRINSCLTLAVMHEHDTITTIEGLANGNQLHPMQAAFLERDGFQCGYCTPGQIMSAVGFLSEKRGLDEATVRESMSGNICRCGAYPHIVSGIVDVGSNA